MDNSHLDFSAFILLYHQAEEKLFNFRLTRKFFLKVFLAFHQSRWGHLNFNIWWNWKGNSYKYWTFFKNFKKRIFWKPQRIIFTYLYTHKILNVATHSIAEKNWKLFLTHKLMKKTIKVSCKKDKWIQWSCLAPSLSSNFNFRMWTFALSMRMIDIDIVTLMSWYWVTDKSAMKNNIMRGEQFVNRDDAG